MPRPQVDAGRPWMTRRVGACGGETCDINRTDQVTLQWTAVAKRARPSSDTRSSVERPPSALWPYAPLDLARCHRRDESLQYFLPVSGHVWSMRARVAVATLALLVTMVGVNAVPSGAAVAARYCSGANSLGPRVTAYRNAPHGGTLFSIVYINRGSSACKIGGIPGAMPVSGPSRAPVGPPSIRTAQPGRGRTIVIQPHTSMETDFVVGLTPAQRFIACPQKMITAVIVRPMGVPQMVVQFPGKAGPRLMTCVGSRNTWIYGFKLASGNPPRPKPSP
jgi:hypothetical protein